MFYWRFPYPESTPCAVILLKTKHCPFSQAGRRRFESRLLVEGSSYGHIQRSVSTARRGKGNEVQKAVQAENKEDHARPISDNCGSGSHKPGLVLDWQALHGVNHIDVKTIRWYLSLIHISEPTRQAEISYAVFCLK